MSLIRLTVWSFVSVLVIGVAFAASGATAGGLVATKGAVVTGADGTTGVANQDGPRYVVLAGILAKLEDQRIAQYRALPQDMAIPAVTIGGDPGGLSADGSTLALSDAANAFQDRSELLAIETERFRTIERISLEGSFIFDAISPDGSLIYLVHLFDPRNPIDYEVRVYDVEAGRLLQDPVLDPSEPEEQMGGYPYARATSADGRWAYTLYDGGTEPFIHALDTVGRTAVCVDLDEAGVPIGNGSTLEVTGDGATLLLGRGGEQLASIDTADWEVGPPPATDAPVAAEADTGGDAWKLVAGVGALGLLVAALFLWSFRARRPAAQARGSASSPSEPSESTNASASERARSGSMP